MFSLAPTAPSAVTVQSVSPYGVDVGVEVFGDSLGDVTVRANVTDSQNRLYPIRDVRVVRDEGGQGVVRVAYGNGTRMVPGENYTLSVQTRVDNDTWSYPITSSVSLGGKLWSLLTCSLFLKVPLHLSIMCTKFLNV